MTKVQNFSNRHQFTGAIIPQILEFETAECERAIQRYVNSRIAPLPPDYGTCLKRMYALVKEHNEKVDDAFTPYQVRSVSPTGRETSRWIRKDAKRRISGACLRTLEFIIKFWCDDEAKYYEYAQRSGEPYQRRPLRANNALLSSINRACPRTAYNHLQKLIDAGILRKKFRGWQNDYELTLAPKIYIDPSPVVMLNSAPHRVKILLIMGQVKIQLHEIINSPVGNLLGQSSGQRTTPRGKIDLDLSIDLHTAANPAKNIAAAAGVAPAPASNEPVHSDVSKSIIEARKTLKNTQTGVQPDEPEPPKIPQWALLLVRDLWIYAKFLLWPERNYTPDYEALIQAKILHCVYHDFADLHNKRFTREDFTTWIQARCKERIDRAAQWLHSPGDTIAVHKGKGETIYTHRPGKKKFVLKPLVWFDTSNPNNITHGWKATRKWQQQTEHRRYTDALEKMLHQAKKELSNSDNKLLTYQSWERRFKRVNVHAWEVFCKTISTSDLIN